METTNAPITPEIQALDEAIEIVGGVTALASAIGEKQPLISNWRKRGRVPAEYCPSIEKAVGGKVRCERLCPGTDWAYLRESAGAPA